MENKEILRLSRETMADSHRLRDTLRRETPQRVLVFAPWAALEPEEGRFDAEALSAVREELMAVLRMDAEPVLCLYAGEDPAWFLQKGGWGKEDNLRCYLRYAGKLVRAVGHLASEYVTFFEPNELSWSRWFFSVINTDKSLHEIDLYAQDCIRYIISGSRKKTRFRVTYDDMKALGYRSLVHEYYEMNGAADTKV